MQRRSFLQHLSASAVATTAAAPNALAESFNWHSQPYLGKKLGVALVGLGSYSQHLAKALTETTNCNLAGLVSGTPAKAEEWRKKYDIAPENVYNYENFDQIKSNPNIDVVYVVLPNNMHRQYVERAAKAGKHVICEKPMAITVDDCQAMIDACKTANVQLAIGYRMHFEPHTLEIMRINQQKTFGAVKLIEASFGFRIGDPTQWRLKQALAGGGPLMDVGIYAVNAARYSTGEEPISVTAQFGPKTDAAKFSEVEESVFWQFEMPSGAVVNSSSTYNANVERLYAAYENGWLELSPAYGYGPIKGKTSKGPMQYEHKHHQTLQMQAMAQILIDGQPMPAHVSGEEGLRDVRYLSGIYEAARTGKKIVF